jgi:hypothetical protein
MAQLHIREGRAEHEKGVGAVDLEMTERRRCYRRRNLRWRWSTEKRE